MKTTPRQRSIRLRSAGLSVASELVLPDSPSSPAVVCFTDGKYGLWEAIVETARRLGEVDVWVASFAFGPDQAEALMARIADRTILSARVLLHSSMTARTGDRRDLREILVGDAVQVRLGNNHAKWAIVHGNQTSVLLLSSSNLTDARAQEFVVTSMLDFDRRMEFRARFNLDFFAGKEWA